MRSNTNLVKLMWSLMHSQGFPISILYLYSLHWTWTISHSSINRIPTLHPSWKHFKILEMPLKNLLHVLNTLNYKEIGFILRKETVWQSLRIKGCELKFCKNIMTLTSLDTLELTKLINLYNKISTGQKWERIYTNLKQLAI